MSITYWQLPYLYPESVVMCSCNIIYNLSQVNCWYRLLQAIEGYWKWWKKLQTPNQENKQDKETVELRADSNIKCNCNSKENHKIGPREIPIITGTGRTYHSINNITSAHMNVHGGMLGQNYSIFQTRIQYTDKHSIVWLEIP